jgi:hypothetical protein
MKLSPFVIGVISAQGSGDYDYGAADTTAEDDRHSGYYGGSDNSWSGMGSSNWNYGGGRVQEDIQATAVTCWESNNMGSHGAHHQHMYDQADEYGWANTHHGHETSVGTINIVNNVAGTSVSQSGDYHSALAFDHRLSGCIYEVAGWDFNANTYNKIHYMTFGSTGGTPAVGYDTGNGNIFPVWWHYFNAHTMAGGSTFQHQLVMANPTYEGLGYLNFIVTFLKGATVDGERDPSTNDFNVDENAVPTTHTDLYANGDQFTLSLVKDEKDCSSYAALTTDYASADSRCYSSQYAQDILGAELDWVTGGFRPSVSSFPHNDLGKDFRFNLRMMHHLGEGDSTEFFDSYYFYRVNTITIVFPSEVSCPYEIAHDASAQIVHKCMDSAGFNGHQETEPFNPAATNVPRFTEALTDTSTTTPTRFPALCSATGVVGKHSCGETYTVNGLMNMYDEYAQQEFGTHQELWFQFYYKYQWTSSVQGSTTEFHSDSTDVYNYPNKLFNAFEIVSIAGSCDTTNLQAWNKNRCTGGDTTDSRVHETWSENVQSGR